MPLTDNNVVYYFMEEVSGAQRADAISGLTLNNNGNVTQVVGKYGYGAGFNPTSIFVGTDWLSHADNAYFSIDKAGANGFSLTFWAYPTVSGQGGGMVAKGFLNGGNQLEWQVLQNTSNNTIQFLVSYDGSHTNTAVSVNQMSLNAWNFCYCWYRSSDGQIGAQVGCTNPGTSTLSPNTPFNGTGDFTVGRYFNNVAGYWAGRIDELSIWQRMLTAPEIAQLCPGLQYPYGEDRAGWKLYCMRSQNASNFSANAYGSPTYFVFELTDAGAKYYQERPVADTDGAQPGEQVELSLVRDGSDPTNTDTRRQTAIELVLSIPVKDVQP